METPIVHDLTKTALRDLFAAVAMHGIVSERPIERNTSGTLNKRDLEGVCSEAYRIANQMLIARNE